MRAPGSSWLRTLASAAWLGWKVETSWADPFVFAVYALLKPISGAITVVVMIRVVSGATADPAMLAFAFLGSTFHGFFANVLGGLAFVIIEEREFYETLHYVYISPASFLAYLMGRASTRFALTVVSAVLVLVLGTLLLGLPIPLPPARPLLLLVAMALGFCCLTTMGVLVAGLALMLTHRVWYLMDGIASVLFFFSGSLFPLEQLPAPLRLVSRAMPTTYWMELVRRSLAPATARLSAWPAASEAELVGVLAAMTAATTMAAAFTFHRCVERARRMGYIHRKTHF